MTQLPAGPRAPKAVQTLRWWARPVPLFEDCLARYGRRFTLRLLIQQPMVLLSDPDDIREVFTAPPDVLHPGEGARILEPIVGRHSVILLDEDAHMEQRKLLLPAFHGERMARLADLVTEVTEREVARWPRDRPVALHPLLQELTLEVILRAVFGLDPGRRLDGLRERLTAALEWGASPGALFDDLFPVLERVGPWARMRRMQAEADELLFELIDERRAEGDTGRDDVLTMLLAARHDDGTPMTHRELRDELVTLLVAGHETTASALAWAFERLTQTPEVLARLTAEVDGGDDDAYLTATVQETLRRRPVLPNAAPRLVKQPVTVGGVDYPVGVVLSPLAYGVQHDPSIYPEPYAFRPERFLDGAPGTYTWIPFGGGRRRCLGASFALLEMKTVLRAVLARDEVRAGGGRLELTRRRSITLSPGRGARMVLRARAATPGAVGTASPEPVGTPA
jgi:cytochrome P450